MKKISNIKKYKRYQKQKARRELRNRLRHRKWRKWRNRTEQGVSRYILKYKHENQNERWQYNNTVTAPAQFSFVENTEGVVRFIRELERLYEGRKRVFVELKRITEIDYGAITVLLSIMVNFKAKKIKFKGSYPRNPKARDLLVDSGFFEKIWDSIEEKEKYEISTKGYHGIHTHACKCVEAELTADIIKSASERIWGEERRCQGVQRSLIELMHNTNNHAEIGKKGEKHWWLSVRYNEEAKKMCFSFVDFGVGIFRSLAKKPSNSKWFGWAAKIQKRIKFGDNSEILKLILNGDFHKIVTEKYYRGKGLPGIAEVQQRNQISNLKIVTNDVSCSFGNDEYIKMRTSFSGTFIYWELNENNESCR